MSSGRHPIHSLRLSRSTSRSTSRKYVSGPGPTGSQRRLTPCGRLTMAARDAVSAGRRWCRGWIGLTADSLRTGGSPPDKTRGVRGRPPRPRECVVLRGFGARGVAGADAPRTPLRDAPASRRDLRQAKTRQSRPRGADEVVAVMTEDRSFLTARDAEALGWIGEQYGVREDALRVLLGRWRRPGRGTQLRGSGALGYQAARDVVGRWERNGWVERRRLFGGRVWVIPTARGLEVGRRE